MSPSLLHTVCPHCQAVNRLPVTRLEERPQCGRCHQSLFNGKPIELGAQDFDRHLQRGDLPLLVDFWAPWCGPCHAMAPEFERAAAQLEPRMRLAKLNTEAVPSVAQRYGIRSIPTLILFRQGRELARQSGALPSPALVQWALRQLG